MSKIPWRAALVAAALSAITVGPSSAAEAGKIQNHSGYDLYFAAAKGEAAVGVLTAKGWYKIPAGESAEVPAGYDRVFVTAIKGTKWYALPVEYGDKVRYGQPLPVSYYDVYPVGEGHAFVTTIRVPRSNSLYEQCVLLPTQAAQEAGYGVRKFTRVGGTVVVGGSPEVRERLKEFFEEPPAGGR